MDINISGLNVEAGLSNVGDDEEIYRLVLIAFVEEGKDNIDNLLSTKDSDIKNFIVYSHALKSACNNIGATDLGEKARLLEFAGKDNDLTYINASLDSFINELKELIISLEGYLG